MANRPITEREWLNLKEAAERLGISKPTAKKYVADGTLKAHQRVPGGVLHIPVASVDALLAEWAGNSPKF